MKMPTCSILRSSILCTAIALGLVAASVPVRAESPAPLPEYVIAAFGSPPQVSDVPLTGSVQAAIQTAFVDSITSSSWGPDQQAALEVVTASGDPRLAWIISDLMRFVTGGTLANTLGTAAADLLQINPPTSNHWGIITDQLIAWDIPAPPDYLSVKRAIFTGVVPQWSALFVEGDID